MPIIQYLILTISIFSTLNIWAANCLSDIYSASVSFDSLQYQATDKDNNLASISSERAMNFQFSKIQFCPDWKLEFLYSIQLKSFKLDNSEDEFTNLSPDRDLWSAGSEAHYSYSQNWELVAQLEFKEDLKIYTDEQEIYLQAEKFMNFSAMIGARYQLASKGNTHYTASTKVGMLIPTDSDIEVGQAYQLGLEAFYRFARKASLKAEVTHSYSQQEVKSLLIVRRDLGLLTGLVFRF